MGRTPEDTISNTSQAGQGAHEVYEVGTTGWPWDRRRITLQSAFKSDDAHEVAAAP